MSRSKREIVDYSQLEVGQIYKVDRPGSEPFSMIEKLDGQFAVLTEGDFYFKMKILCKRNISNSLFHSSYKFIKLS
jgi:hypothetical protein